MTGTNSMYDIAIIMPVLNEEKFIGQTLEQLYMQDFPMDKVEIVIADGGSTDNTKEIVKTYKNRFGSLKILDNPRGLASAGRNLGVRNSDAPYIMILDGHVYLPDNNLLKSIVETFEKTDAKCLCRAQPLTPPNLSEFEKSVALCRGSLLGHKPGSEIYSDFEGAVDPTSSGAMYHREVFDEIDYFDENFDACEDVDFNYRVNKASLKAVLSPKLKVFYYPRNSLQGLWKQMQRYGKGRFDLSLKHNFYSPMQLLAAGGVVGFFGLLLLSLLFPPLFELFRSATGLYLLIVILFSIFLGLKEKHFGCILFGPLIFPTIHFGLGVGFLRGIFNKYIKNR